MTRPGRAGGASADLAPDARSPPVDRELLARHSRTRIVRAEFLGIEPRGGWSGTHESAPCMEDVRLAGTAHEEAMP